MDKYIVLTNKETFQTKVDSDGLEAIETYNFYFFDKIKAKYTIAKVSMIRLKLTSMKNMKEKNMLIISE